MKYSQAGRRLWTGKNPSCEREGMTPEPVDPSPGSRSLLPLLLLSSCVGGDDLASPATLRAVAPPTPRISYVGAVGDLANERPAFDQPICGTGFHGATFSPTEQGGAYRSHSTSGWMTPAETDHEFRAFAHSSYQCQIDAAHLIIGFAETRQEVDLPDVVNAILFVEPVVALEMIYDGKQWWGMDQMEHDEWHVDLSVPPGLPAGVTFYTQPVLSVMGTYLPFIAYKFEVL